MRFENKVALVTASGGVGIGRAVALKLASEGAKVVVSDIHERRAKEVATEIASQTQTETLGIACDVRNRDQVDEMVAQTIQQWGRIDILVNNAGTDRVSSVADMDDDTWSLVIETNLYSTFYCCRAVLPQMISQKWGRIVNMSSVAQWEGLSGHAHYSAAKAAVSAFGRCLAGEVAEHSITVNAIAPSTVWNPFMSRVVSEEDLEGFLSRTPLGRFCKPEEVANVIAFLCSDDAEYITGDVITVAGGFYYHA